MLPKTATIEKSLGQTPLEALEQFRRDMIENDRANCVLWERVPLTYAGRLDPLAYGKLLIIIGDECKKKDEYLDLDKEYEIEIVFGISTDSYDALGLPRLGGTISSNKIKDIDFSKYIGKFIQKYPPYSSKTVGGKQLHTLSRVNLLPEEMPEKEVEIYSIEKMEPFWDKIEANKLLERVCKMIDLVRGDFRQKEIKERWSQLLEGKDESFPSIKMRVKCSSGTYMRSLANRLGEDFGCGAFVISIWRTEIFIE